MTLNSAARQVNRRLVGQSANRLLALLTGRPPYAYVHTYGLHGALAMSLLDF
jgi:hypothetical protein